MNYEKRLKRIRITMKILFVLLVFFLIANFGLTLSNIYHGKTVGSLISASGILFSLFGIYQCLSFFHRNPVSESQDKK